jgi:zinc/manganese transport system substrate-binding protein
MNSRVTRSTLAVAGITAAVLALTSCGATGQPGTGATTEKIKVVASTNVWGSVVQAVGGDVVEVTSILADPSADPHSYEGKPADAVAIAEAKLAIYNGGGYDDFFVSAMDSSGTSARKVAAFQVSGKGGAQPGEINEHVWYDLPTVRKVSTRIAEDLSAIAPQHKDTFAGNATAFDTAITGLISKAEAIGKGSPDRKIVATEPIADYLVELAGLENVTPGSFAEAIEEETDPPAAAIAEITELINGRQVAALITNPQTEIPVTTQLEQTASAAGIPAVAMTETLPEGTDSYLDWMTQQLDALSVALRK